VATHRRNEAAFNHARQLAIVCFPNDTTLIPIMKVKALLSDAKVALCQAAVLIGAEEHTSCHWFCAEVPTPLDKAHALLKSAEAIDMRVMGDGIVANLALQSASAFSLTANEFIDKAHGENKALGLLVPKKWKIAIDTMQHRLVDLRKVLYRKYNEVVPLCNQFRAVKHFGMLDICKDRGSAVEHLLPQLVTLLGDLRAHMGFIHSVQAVNFCIGEWPQQSKAQRATSRTTPSAYM